VRGSCLYPFSLKQTMIEQDAGSTWSLSIGIQAPRYCKRLELTKPLGLYNQRSKHLIELGKVIVENFGKGVLCDKEALKHSPGFGD